MTSPDVLLVKDKDLLLLLRLQPQEPALLVWRRSQGHEIHDEVTSGTGLTDENNGDEDDEHEAEKSYDEDKLIESGDDKKGLLIHFSMGEFPAPAVVELTYRTAAPRLVSAVPQHLGQGARAPSTLQAACPRPLARQGRRGLRLVRLNH